MSRIEELISKYCPNGVEYKKLSAVVSQNTFKQLGASELEMLKTDSGDVKLLPSSSNYDWWSTKEKCIEHLCQGEVITLGRARYANIKYHKGYFVSSNNIVMTSKNPSLLSVKFLLHFIKHNSKNFYVETSTYPKFDKKTFDDFFIPVPPLPVQEEIVKILDSFTELEAELEARKKQYEHYKQKCLDVCCEKRHISDIATIKARVGWQRLTTKEYLKTGDYYLITGTDFQSDGAINFDTCVYVNKTRYDMDENIQVHKNDILVTKDGTLGKVAFLSTEPDKPTTLNSGVFRINISTKDVSPRFLYYYFTSKQFKDFVENVKTGSTVPHLTQQGLLSLSVAIPPLEEQERIVSILDRFDTLVNDISKGLPAEIKARRGQYEYYRDKLLTFEPIAA